jgi:phosphonate transport system substrate-binding protein
MDVDSNSADRDEVNMTSKTIPGQQRERKDGCAAWPGVLLLFLLVPLSLILFACDRDNPRVDMAQVSNRSGAEQEDQRPVLQIAVGAMVSPEATRRYYEELLRLIAERMGRRAVFLQRQSYAEVNALVKDRKVDLAFVSTGPYVQGHADFGMELLAVPVVQGRKVYYSYIIVHQTSKIKSFAELRGKKFAFSDPLSNSGAIVPTYMLAKRGETPKSFFKEFFYSHSHDNSIKAVAEQLCDGAAVDSLIWDFFQSLDPRLTGQTKIIEKSPPYGIPPFVVHPDLDSATKAELKKVLLSLHQQEAAKAVLAKLQIDRFAEGDDAMYDSVREMNRWLNRKPGQ